MDIEGNAAAGGLMQMQRQVFQRADANGDGKISQEEFQAAGEQAGGAEAAAIAGELFADLDGNGDGQLTQEEVAQKVAALARGQGPGGGLAEVLSAKAGGGASVDQLLGTTEEEEEALDLLLREYEEAIESGNFAKLQAMAGSLSIRA